MICNEFLNKKITHTMKKSHVDRNVLSYSFESPSFLLVFVFEIFVVLLYLLFLPPHFSTIQFVL